jgi:hypothetical protein
MEIPAGTRVKVATTQKGETTMHDAEVLAHMDGLVHVNIDGQAVSVDLSQVVTPDAPAAAAGAPIVEVPAMPTENGNEKVTATMIAELSARVAALEGAVGSIESRVTSIEARLAATQFPEAPENETQPTNESKAAAESGEPAAGS